MKVMPSKRWLGLQIKEPALHAKLKASYHCVPCVQMLSENGFNCFFSGLYAEIYKGYLKKRGWGAAASHQGSTGRQLKISLVI